MSGIFTIRACLISLFILLLVPTATSAIQVTVVNGSFPNSINEGDPVNYVIEISSLPRQTAIVELETDLIPEIGNILWNISSSDQWEISGGESAFREQHLELKALGDWSSPMHVQVTGSVPVLTEVTQHSGLVITKMPERTTGFTYYRLQALDDKGLPVGTAVTKTFDIIIPEDETFTQRVNDVQDIELRGIVSELYDLGLIRESKMLLDYAEKPKESGVPIPVVGAALAAVAIIAAAVGYYVRGKRSWSPE
ncbi:hypothetical protein [Methanoculleus sp. UBA430]|uniref:hypothetical protein n=1 Tax=Methanoculleus sp. UBA430 TaxID=1915511 RepID=UPI0025DF49A5|nr:hypothetical protein [Methanoculleus sp. UBA430]